MLLCSCLSSDRRFESGPVWLLLTLMGVVPGCARLEGTLEETEVYAEPLGTTYTQTVYLPPGAEIGGGAPWVLLLDADVWAESAAQQLDEAVRDGRADPVVVVGLGHQATRSRDYTPMPAEGVPEASEGSIGEIDAFFEWLVDDWMPELEATLGIGGERSSRTLTGHSYGGLATTWALFHYTQTFSCYGIASPSLWWDDGVAFSWEAKLEEGHATVVYGALEEATVLSLVDVLIEDLEARDDITVDWRRLEGEDHRTVASRSAWGVVFEGCHQ